MQKSECVDFGRTADRIYINAKYSTTLLSNGGGMGVKTGLYLLPKTYNISADKSNCMLSSNPHSGIQEITTARTLDLNGANPNCNQGG